MKSFFFFWVEFKKNLLCFSCWTVLEQTSEAFDGVLHPHVQKLGTGRSNGAEGVIFNPVTNLWDNVWERIKKKNSNQHCIASMRKALLSQFFLSLVCRLSVMLLKWQGLHVRDFHVSH